MIPRSSFYLAALIATTLVAIFFVQLSFPWMEIEDSRYFKENPLFQNGTLLQRLLASWQHAPEWNYIPVTWNFTLIFTHFFGDTPFVFRLLSLALHLINALLAFWLLQRWNVSLLPAFFTVLLFAIHPLRVESIVWASSIKGLLAAFFALAVLLIRTFPPSKYQLPLLVLLTSLCFLSKQTLLLLPGVIILTTHAFGQKKLSLRTLVTLVCLSLLALGIALAANHDNPNLITHRFLESGLTPIKAVSALGHYLMSQVLPMPLYPEYANRAPLGLIILGILSLSACFLVSFFLIQKKPLPINCSLFACACILLLPILGWTASPLEFAADRLTYFPSLFFWGALTVTLHQWIPRLAIPLFSIAAIIFINLTVKQLSYWKDATTLSEHILKYEPDHRLASFYLAGKFATQSEYQKALSFTTPLTQTHPHYFGTWERHSQILLAAQKGDEALAVIETALATPSPITDDLHLLHGQILMAMGSSKLALVSFQQALKAGADPFTVAYRSAEAFHNLGELHKSQAEISKALAIRPKSPIALALKKHLNLSASSSK